MAYEIESRIPHGDPARSDYRASRCRHGEDEGGCYVDGCEHNTLPHRTCETCWRRTCEFTVWDGMAFCLECGLPEEGRS